MAKEKVKAKLGAPSKKPILKQALEDGLIQKWGEIGMTDKQIADQLRVGLTILYEYKKENPKFAKVLTQARLGKPTLDAWNGLYRLSTGFHEKTTRTTIKTKRDSNGEIICTEEETIIEDNYVPPQHQACAKLLANYYHQAKRASENAVPEQYITEPVPEQQQDRSGRLDVLDGAMKELFFGPSEEQADD